MKIPFACLLATILIPYALSALGGYYRAKQFGSVDNRHPRAQQRALEGTGARVQAAQENAREILPVFASGVFVAYLNHANAASAVMLSTVFLASRLVHAGCYIADWATARSLVFLVGLGCSIALFFV